MSFHEHCMKIGNLIIDYKIIIGNGNLTVQIVICNSFETSFLGWQKANDITKPWRVHKGDHHKASSHCVNSRSSVKDRKIT